MTDPLIAEQGLRFTDLFLSLGRVWLELNKVVVTMVELEMRAKGVEESDEELVSIMLLVVCEVTGGDPDSTEDLRRHGSGDFCSISPPVDNKRGGKMEEEGGGGWGSGGVPGIFIDHFEEF
jgi:hypothetical protein